MFFFFRLLMIYPDSSPSSFSSLVIFPPTTIHSSREWSLFSSLNVPGSLPSLCSEHAVSLSKDAVSIPTSPVHYFHWVIFSIRSLPLGELIAPWSPVLRQVAPHQPLQHLALSLTQHCQPPVTVAFVLVCLPLGWLFSWMISDDIKVL